MPHLPAPAGARVQGLTAYLDWTEMTSEHGARVDEVARSLVRAVWTRFPGSTVVIAGDSPGPGPHLLQGLPRTGTVTVQVLEPGDGMISTLSRLLERLIAGTDALIPGLVISNRDHELPAGLSKVGYARGEDATWTLVDAVSSPGDESASPDATADCPSGDVPLPPPHLRRRPTTDSSADPAVAGTTGRRVGRPGMAGHGDVVPPLPATRRSPERLSFAELAAQVQRDISELKHRGQG